VSKESTTTYPLSFQQERVWPGTSKNASRRATCYVQIRGLLDRQRLRDSIRSVVAAQEILRVTLHDDSGIPEQYVADSSDFDWLEEDLTFMEPPARSTWLQQWMDQQADLETASLEPPLRVVLARLDSDSHALLVSLPPYCADVVSLDRILGSIAVAYSGEEQSEELLQYGDYALWQQEMFTAEDTRAGREFWTGYVDRLEPRKWGRAWPSIVRVDSPEPNSHFRVPLNPSLTTALDTLASQFGVATPVALLACWHVLLTRISQFATQLIGYSCDGRDYSEFNTAIGPFARWIPLQTTSSADTRFSDLLAELGRAVDEIQGWQQSYSGLPKDVQSQAVPEIGFEYMELTPERISNGVSFLPMEVRSSGEDFVLCLSAQRQGKTFWIDFGFDPARLDRETVQQWAECYLNLVQSAVDDPRTQVGRLRLLNEAQRNRLLVEWNQTVTEYPRNRCMQELIQEQAARTPERIAVRCMEHVLTYRELNEQSNQLAHWLRAHGVGPDQRVGLCLDRNLDMVVGLVGILKAGGAYVPLNPEHPPLRLAQQLEGAVALATDEAALPQTSSFPGSVVCLDRDRDTLLALPTTDPSTETTSENLVYVLFTSGSTGVPKGVAARHRNLVNYTWFARALLEVDKHPEGLNFSLVSTICADVGLTCIYPALTSGGCLHVVPYDVAADSARYAEYAAAANIDVLKIVPSHLLALLTSGGGRAVLPKRFVVVGGERLTHELMEKITAENVGCEIVNHYAPSETTCGSLTLRMSTFDWRHWQGASMPLGRPIANTHLYVLDAQQEPVPIGAIGELYIAGDGVSSGYAGDPKRTAERFLPDPFNAGLTMYRSGDVVRYVSDGNIEFLERVDDQVKIRGFRVELGEVQSAIQSYPGVKQAIVLARDSARGKRILAWAVGHPGVNLSGDELRDHVKQRLPEYMVPTKVIVLPRMPLTQNGKIDRQNLPEPEEVTVQTVPRTKLEQTVAEVWCTVLKLDRIDVDQNFFEIGGHSLLATQIIARLRERLNAPIPVRALFENPTITRLANELANTVSLGGQAPSSAIKPVPRNRPLPLSLAQEAVWVHDQFEPGNSAYNIPRAWRLKGPLNSAALQSALNEIVRRHEILRTVFIASGGQPVQVVRDSVFVPIANYDLSSGPIAHREDAARQIVEQEAERSFDMERGPLLRAYVIAYSAQDHVLLLVMHHIVSDAWSASIFFRELKSLYEAYAGGHESSLPELSIQFGDYAVHERGVVQGNVLEDHLNYWREALRDGPEVLALPTDRPRTNGRSFRGGHHKVQLGPDLAKRVKELALTEGTTPFVVLMSAFQTLLWSYSGQNQIVVGSDFANRTTPEVEALIGFFVNVLPIRAIFSESLAFRDVLAQVKKAVPNAQAHQQLPLGKIVEAVQPQRSSSHSPLVQALFVYQNAPTTEKSLTGLQFEPFEIPVTRSKFDLAVFVAETHNTYESWWVYSVDLFEPETVLAIAHRFEDLLSKVLADPQAPISAHRQSGLKPNDGANAVASSSDHKQEEVALNVDASATVNASPLTPTERIVADIWCDVLGVSTLAVHANLFEIGGHSLTATQIAARLRQRFGRAIYVRTLFDNPTVRDLARLVDQNEVAVHEVYESIQRAPRIARKASLDS
jgi:amino acid adenylation domain-containing protein